jgi:hypothetical protein
MCARRDHQRAHSKCFTARRRAQPPAAPIKPFHERFAISQVVGGILEEIAGPMTGFSGGCGKNNEIRDADCNPGSYIMSS